MVLAALALLALAAPARAGHWVLTTTGSGWASAGSSGQSFTAPGPASNTVTIPALGAGSGNTVPVQGSAKLQVTVTGTWTPDGPQDTAPPPGVYLTENSQAEATDNADTATGGTGPTQAGTADDGWGDPVGQSGPSLGVSAPPSGPKYVAASGGSFTVSLTLKASASASPVPYWTGGSPGRGQYNPGFCSASVGVGPIVVTANSVTISPGGAVQDSSGNWDLLVGQHCAPTLQGIPTGEGSNYQWSVTGTTFQSWTVSADQSHTTEVDGPGPLNGPNPNANPAVPSPGWYWNDAASKTPETITCTATVTPPTGEGSSFSVTVTQLVTVYTPKWTGPATGGAVGINNDYPGATGWVLYAGPASANETAGMVWTPTEAPPVGTPLGDGTLSLVQLLTPDRSFSVSSGSYAQNLPQGLDTQYPYGWNTGAPNYKGQDSPAIGLTVSPVGGTASKAMMQDNFVDYLMYTPPGGVAVPLGQFPWGTNATVIEPQGGWGGGIAGTVTPQSGSFTANNSFPKWTSLINKNTPYVKQ